ncbi:hypothetical protein PLESTB_000656900 [Pleodorina starrii]|uniref:Uncharacterized protein n=1 Tax=Pleodorina starrii TaxID=330485 RepID=A0A9W6BIM3_9CHLO|nr:hypothetical protein PLESTM_001323500 [Pleodorina starrii]GLC52683.1 hypothetical protein PLESTB_000656900 [Pleodorina starrii]GLC71689.1 hypothetical protein PLESTF_001149700 [Pleodorina starrii]
MADSKRAELVATVTDACEGLAECGFLGLLETPVLQTFTNLHKFNDTERLTDLIAALEGAATRMISAKAPPGFPELMVVSQLLQDVDGPGAPPEGADSPLDPEFKSLSANLRLALCSALLQFARPGSEEAAEGLEVATGMLLMVHEKVAADPLVTLAVEHAMLRLLGRRKGCVALLRGRTWALAALNKQVEALASYNPETDANGCGEAAEEEEDNDDDEEAEDEDEELLDEEEGDGAEADGGEGQEEEEAEADEDGGDA